jgi:hypothetical protein
MAMLAGALALAVALGGCGGSDGGGDESGAKAEYVDKANAICAKGLKQLGDELAAYTKDHEGKGSKKSDSAEVVEDVVLPVFREEVSSLSDLEAPSGDEDQIAKMLDQFEQGIEEGEEDPGGFFETPENGVSKGRKAAESYGIKGCGSFF